MDAKIISGTDAPASQPVRERQICAGEARRGVVFAAAACFVLSLAMHLPWLAVTPIAGTEGHRIFPADQMVRTHWWLVPMLFDKPFATKPPLHHWLIAAGEILSGRGPSFDVGGPKALFFWRLPSALAGAALCAALAWFAGRWFGRRAAWISGLCALGMIAVWGQSQVADIDSTNTLATVLTALCGIELLIVRPRQVVRWIVAASIAMAAMWMTKGPAGLPIVLGVWLWALARAWHERLARAPKCSTGESPVPRERSVVLGIMAWVVPLLIGGGVFGLWAWLATRSIVAHGFVMDLRGAKEGSERALPHSVGDVIATIVKIMPQVVAFGLPVTLALILWLRIDVRRAMDDRTRKIAWSLVGATLISWVICIGVALPNPRYAYPTLMLMCPLAGAVAVSAAKQPRAADWLRGIAIGCAVAFVVVAIGLTYGSRRDKPLLPLSVGSCMIAIVIAWWTFSRLNRSWNAAWGLVGLIVCASMPFGVQRHWARTTSDSAITIAPKLEKTVGTGNIIAVAGAVTSKPEAFFYAHLRTKTYDVNDFLPGKVQRGTWIMLDQAEHKRWLSRPNSGLDEDRKFCKWGKTDYYLAWFPP